MRKLLITGAAVAAALLGIGAGVDTALAEGSGPHPPHKHWHFEGPFGTYDRAAAQRLFRRSPL